MSKKILALGAALIVALSCATIGATAASADASSVTISGTLLDVNGLPVSELPVSVSSNPWDGCNYPSRSGPKTEADGSFSFSFDETYDPAKKYVLCLGIDVYGGPTWAWADRVFIDLSRDLNIGVVQRESSATVSLRWLVDRAFISLVNEDSTTQAHAINVDTGRVYRGRFDAWEGDGVWETLDVPYGRYRFAVRTLWWDEERWIYYPDSQTAEGGEIVEIGGDTSLPKEVQANPGIVKIGASPWGTDRDWQTESCTTDWSHRYAYELWPDPEPNQWVLPIGLHRFALYRDGRLWDWTECIQVEPHGIYEAEWTQEFRVIPPASVAASATEVEADGERFHQLTVGVESGPVNTYVPTYGYDITVFREGTQESFGGEWFDAPDDPGDPLTVSLRRELPAGSYVVSARAVIDSEGRFSYSDPVQSASFEVSELAPSPTPVPTPSPTSSPTASPSPSPTFSPSPTSSPSPTVAPVPTPSPTVAPTPTASPPATASPSPVPTPSEVPGAPQAGPGNGGEGGTGSPHEGGGGSLAKTGALTPPLALPIFAVAALMAAGLLRIVNRRAALRDGRRQN